MKTELLDAHLTGDLSEDQKEAVELALRNDEALREVYFRQLRMDLALRVLLSNHAEVSGKAFTQGVLARLYAGEDRNREFSKSVLTEILEEQDKIVPMRWPDLVKSAAAAAVAALLAIIGLKMVDLQREMGHTEAIFSLNNGPSQRNYLARVQSARDAHWSNEENVLIRNDGWISNGVLELKSGVVEIAFNSGARAFVEGPAKLSIESENRTFLEFGSMTAEVPEEASGFTVNTPRMNMVDIGTRFGVTVDSVGDTEVHVMEGLVEVSRSSGNSVGALLREGLALKADSRPLSDLKPVAYAGDRFKLSAGSWQDSSPVIKYNFDESGGGQLFDTGNRRKGGPYDLSLIGGSGFDRKPRRAPGMYGQCLVFEGSEPLTTSVSKDFRLEDPFTITFWVKIPPRVGRENDDNMISFGREMTGWELGCRSAFGGGTLIVRNGDAFVAGSTDLADGKWHHVAVRFIGGSSVQLNSHVHMYVDGDQEIISETKRAEVNMGRVGELRIGDLNLSGFSGWLDELAVYDQAISTIRIQKQSQTSPEN